MHGFYALTLSSVDVLEAELETMMKSIAAALHVNLLLPPTYALDNIIVYVQSASAGARRRLLGSTIVFGFLLLPAPELPPVPQLQARLAETATTVGIANGLAPVTTNANATGTIHIARSDAAGVAQEPPQPLTREHAALCCCCAVWLQPCQHDACS